MNLDIHCTCVQPVCPLPGRRYFLSVAFLLTAILGCGGRAAAGKQMRSIRGFYGNRDRAYSAWALYSFQTLGYEVTVPGGAANGNAATCFDNGGNPGNPMSYSIGPNNGAGVNAC